MTAVFYTDEESKKPKDLTVGDEVEVHYYGDIYEECYAVEIKILKNKDEDELKTINGDVTEKSDTDMIISVASSHSYVFKLDKNIKVTGKDSDITVGDGVIVTYKGDLMKDPVATQVEIVEFSEKRIFKKVDVTVTEISDKTFKGKTKLGNTYTFYLLKKTKYQGEKFTKGCEATVRYTGEIETKPEVDSIYVKKQTPVKPTTKPTTKPTAKPTSAPTSKPTAKPTTAPSSQQTEPTESPEISTDAVMVIYGDTGCKVLVNGKTLKLTVDENTDIAIDYEPRPQDSVYITYDKASNYLKAIQLIDRPDIYIDGEIVTWDSKKPRLRVNQYDADRFKELFPKVALDDNNEFVTGISSDLDKDPSSYDPKDEDGISFACVMNGDKIQLVYISFEETNG